MVTEIDITRTPAPPPGPFATLLLALGASLFLGFFTPIPIGLVWWPIGEFFPELHFDRVEASLGLPPDGLFWRLVFGAAAIWMILLTYAAFAVHTTRAPIYGARMGVIAAALRRFRRKLPGLHRGRLWGALNLVAPFLMYAVLLWLGQLSDGRLADIAPPEWRGAFVAALVVAFLGGSAFLIINGARLISGRSSATRYLNSLFLHAAPYLAVIGGVLGGMALGIGWAGLSNGGLLALCLLLGAAIGWFLGRRIDRHNRARAQAMAHQSAKDALWADRRRPILFLRSFKDDTAITNVTGADEPVREDYLDRLEDVLAKIAGQYGPVIAVGQPGMLPKSGAARAYYAGDDWRGAVATWMDQSLFVVMIAGYTKGVRWELDTAIARGHARKLILVFPPDDPHFEARWAWVRDRFASTSTATEMDLVNRHGAVAMHLGQDGALVLLRSNDRVTGNYEAAMGLALYAMFAAPALF